jgi:hypothetical protein
MNSRVLGAVCACLILGCQAANAALIDGTLGIGGAFNPVNAVNTPVTLGVATGIDFTSNGLVLASSGDLSFAFGTTVTMTDFQFNPLSPAGVAVWSVGGFTFNMDAVSINTQDSVNLSLSGTGTVSGSGFDVTAGTWEFTAQASQNAAFTWSSSTVTVVPVPAALWLFGSGLLGLVGIARRKAA